MSSDRKSPEQKTPGNYSCPSSGGTSRPEKSDGVNRHEPLAKPASGFVAHPAKADGRNRTEALANPEGASQPIPKAHLHLDQVKGDTDRTYEPRPAKGAKYPDGSTTTKRGHTGE
jgi:hypothetical protein